MTFYIQQVCWIMNARKKIMLGKHKLLAFGYSDILRGPQNLKNSPIFMTCLRNGQND